MNQESQPKNKMTREEYKKKKAEHLLNTASLSKAVLFIHASIHKDVSKEVDEMDDEQFAEAAKQFEEKEEAGKSSE
tara:strand:+ start:516 stop:743 length:228 start_codon:yes stop_codon:yes gene_type:complete